MKTNHTFESAYDGPHPIYGDHLEIVLAAQYADELAKELNSMYSRDAFFGGIFYDPIIIDTITMQPVVHFYAMILPFPV